MNDQAVGAAGAVAKGPKFQLLPEHNGHVFFAGAHGGNLVRISTRAPRVPCLCPPRLGFITRPVVIRGGKTRNQQQSALGEGRARILITLTPERQREREAMWRCGRSGELRPRSVTATRNLMAIERSESIGNAFGTWQ